MPKRFVSIAILVVAVVGGSIAYLLFRPPPVPPVDEVLVDQGGSFEELPDPVYDDEDWPAWRGPRRDGTRPAAAPPVEWTQENVRWKSAVPGRGHGSPVIVSGRVFLPTADESAKTQSVSGFDLQTGETLWQTEVHQGGLDPYAHQKNTQASSTLASDGELLFAAFLHDGAIWVTGLSLNGDLLWQREVGGFASKFGYAASPVIYGSTVIVAADHRDGGFLSALHRKTGEIVWRKRRSAAESYATPAVLEIGGRDLLLISGGRRVDCYDPATGEAIWSVDGTAEACVGSPISDGTFVFATGGYPQREIVAVDAASGDVVWRAGTKSYVPSLLTHEGFVYQIQDDGILYCYVAADGKEAWKRRLGGNFSASPVLAGSAVFVCDESGKVTVFEASGETYRQLAQNQLGDEIMATPAITGDRLVLRVAEGSGAERTEHLYCLAPVASPDEPAAEDAD